MLTNLYHSLVVFYLLSGFRKRYDYQTALLRMIENGKFSNGYGDIVGSVAIDFSNALDSLPRGLLIAEVHAYGVDLPSCKLISS